MIAHDESVVEGESLNRGCQPGGGFHSGYSQAQATEAKWLSKATDLGSCQFWNVPQNASWEIADQLPTAFQGLVDFLLLKLAKHFL